MHEAFMKEALDLAKQGAFSAHPNPMVGCVITRENQIIGRGFHEKPGTPHAEVHALKEAGDAAKGSTVYVTLEPCCHFGRTPPCVDALIAAQVKEVFISTLDPNPLVAGKGLEKLKAHGIKVHVGLLEVEAKTLNRIFFHYITTKTPYIIGKWAMSLDGEMAVNQGDNPKLSSSESSLDLHYLRHEIPGILIGAQTALKDNPSLTVRIPNAETIRHPQRIVLNTKADLPNTLKLFDGSLPGKTWLVCDEAFATIAQERFDQSFVETLPCKVTDGQIDLVALLKILGAKELAGILVEGGKTILNAFFKQNLINEIITYITPWVIADNPCKIRVQSLQYQNLGGDVKISGILK